MRFGIPALFMAVAALVMVALASPLHATPAIGAGDGAQVTSPHCGTPEDSRDQQLAVQRQVDDWIAGNGAALAVGGNIKIAWHVISDGATGNIPQSMIDATVAVLNAAHAGIPGGVPTGYTFSLASVDRTNNHRWFTMEPGTNEERQAKNTLATDVPHRLNIYSCRPPSGTNWSYFPWSYAEGNKMHGVVLNINHLPGSVWGILYTGDVAVHEVGHYLGLYHTFQGGCTPPGDMVDDTPDMVWGGSWPGCDTLRDSCPSPGVDPIHNYMCYNSDACYTEFSAGQATRMYTMVATYRPNLLNAPIALQGPMVQLARGDRRDDVAGFEFLGAAPNPSRNTIDIRYSIPANESVDLRIFDLAGRTVSVLARGSCTAGAHEVRWSGKDDAGRQLASGVYFLRIQAGSFSRTERILLTR